MCNGGSLVLLLSGSFGVGKTTVASLLRSKLPGSRLFVPEHIGYILRRLPRWAPLSTKAYEDYQELHSGPEFADQMETGNINAETTAWKSFGDSALHDPLGKSRTIRCSPGEFSRHGSGVRSGGIGSTAAPWALGVGGSRSERGPAGSPLKGEGLRGVWVGRFDADVVPFALPDTPRRIDVDVQPCFYTLAD